MQARRLEPGTDLDRPGTFRDSPGNRNNKSSVHGYERPPPWPAQPSSRRPGPVRRLWSLLAQASPASSVASGDWMVGRRHRWGQPSSRSAPARRETGPGMRGCKNDRSRPHIPHAPPPWPALPSSRILDHVPFALVPRRSSLVSRRSSVPSYVSPFTFHEIRFTRYGLVTFCCLRPKCSG